MEPNHTEPKDTILIILKIKKAQNLPTYLKVRAKISELIYTAEVSYETYLRLTQDEMVESVSMSKKLIINSVEK